jgi:hypothetical protein
MLHTIHTKNLKQQKGKEKFKLPKYVSQKKKKKKSPNISKIF